MLVWGYRGVTKGTPRSPLWNVWERQTSVWHVFGFIRMNLLLRALRAPVFSVRTLLFSSFVPSVFSVRTLLFSSSVPSVFSV